MEFKTGKFENSVFCFVDGASRGNPGPSSIGITVKNTKGKNVFELKEYIGNDKTNNIAEYYALLRLFSELKKLHIKNVIVHLDSELVLRQVTGIYRTKDTTLKKLLSGVKKLEKSFLSITYRQITREENKIADRLANIALNLEGY